MDKAYQDKHNKGLDMLQDYKNYLEKQVMNLKKLDEQSEFMKMKHYSKKWYLVGQ